MQHLPSKIFIDGGLPEETDKANRSMLGRFNFSLDGQTTNPTLIAKNLKARSSGDSSGDGARISQQDALNEYKKIVQEMSRLIPNGSISIQVFADDKTLAEDMLNQANERIGWIPNASIKFPCTFQGLKAAEIACQKMPINITLVFSQAQAAAVYQATLKHGYPIFISPFVGRLDDKGENGMDVVKNILKMYQNGDGHVEVLTASVRNIEHIYYALFLKSDIITIPFSVFQLWANENFQKPEENYVFPQGNLKEIPYRDDIVLGRKWQSYDLAHPLTSAGLKRFYDDWMNLFK